MLAEALTEARDIPIPGQGGMNGHRALAIKVSGTADAALAQSSVVEVYERMGEPTTFRLRYQVDIKEQDLPLLADPRLDPGSEMQVLVVLDGAADCLVKGPVHSQQIRLIHGGSGSFVDVLGTDTSVTMDREVKAKVWDALSDSDVVSQIVATYGLKPETDSTPATTRRSTRWCSATAICASSGGWRGAAAICSGSPPIRSACRRRTSSARRSTASRT